MNSNNEVRFKKSFLTFFEAYQCSRLTLESQPNFITKNGQPISGRDTAFKIVPRFHIEPFGGRYELSLKLEVTLASFNNPVAPYSARYMHDGTVYTDLDIGLDPFHAIKLNQAKFNIVVQGPGVNVRTNYETFLGRKAIALVDKDAKSESFVVHVQVHINHNSSLSEATML